jgi:hypothetical protein
MRTWPERNSPSWPTPLRSVGEALRSGTDAGKVFDKLVRPERFELPASWFVARRSIQLSYGRNRRGYRETPVCRPFRAANITTSNADHHLDVAEREGFEPSMGF